MLVIRDWDKTFETAKTRKLVRPRYFSCPTGVDSSGYIELMAHGESGIRAFGIFIAICQWSATRRPEDRGKLAREGIPLEDRQLATYLRVETCHLSAALQLLASKEIGWLIEAENSETCHSSPKTCHSSPNMGSPATQVGRLERSRRGVGEGEESKGEEGSGARACSHVEIPECLRTPEFVEAWNAFVDYFPTAPDNHSGKPMPFQTQSANLMELQRRLPNGGIARLIDDLRLSVRVSKVGNLQDSTKQRPARDGPSASSGDDETQAAIDANIKAASKILEAERR